MRTIIYYGFFLTLLTFTSCGENGTTTSQPTTASAAFTSDGYEITAVAGSDLKLAEKRNEAGKLLESGFIKDNAREGTWTYYNAVSYVPLKVENYHDGKLNGIYLELDRMARVTKSANYKNNVLHGPYAEYRASLAQKTATYKDGKLHGTLNTHTLRSGKVNQSISYVDGLQDGPMRWFNEEGEMIQERLYKKGELVD